MREGRDRARPKVEQVAGTARAEAEAGAAERVPEDRDCDRRGGLGVGEGGREGGGGGGGRCGRQRRARRGAPAETKRGGLPRLIMHLSSLFFSLL